MKDSRVHTREFPGTRSFVDTVNDLGKKPLNSDTGWIRVLLVTDTSDPEYDISPQFQNSWRNVVAVNSPPMAFYLSDDGEVRMRGNIEGGANGTTIFTLPPGFRPEYTERFSVPKNNIGGVSTIEINPNGQVRMIA